MGVENLKTLEEIEADDVAFAKRSVNRYAQKRRKVETIPESWGNKSDNQVKEAPVQDIGITFRLEELRKKRVVN